jgi:hypothetical protein
LDTEFVEPVDRPRMPERGLAQANHISEIVEVFFAEITFGEMIMDKSVIVVREVSINIVYEFPANIAAFHGVNPPI